MDGGILNVATGITPAGATEGARIALGLGLNAESTHLVKPRLAVPAAHRNSASAGFLCLDTTLNLAYFDVMTARYSMIQNGLLLLALTLHREG